MSEYNQVKEINEAISAGERALQSLYRAQEMLNKARTWGIVDIFGGNIVSGLLKHSRLNEAKRYMEDARRDLSYFQRELREVHEPGLSTLTGDFLTFADFFFDGFIADILVQSKINEARNQVAEAIQRTKDKERELKTRLGEAISLLPGKSEQWLMVGIQDDYHLYFRGDDSEPMAFVEVRIFGAPDKAAFERMTAAVTKIFGEVLGIAPDHMYIKYSATADWGWNGSNF